MRSLSTTLINWGLVNGMKKRSEETKTWKAMKPDLLVTMCPSFPHFNRFAHDGRVAGIRFNSAMISLNELDKELTHLVRAPTSTPIYYDVKSRQMRILEVGNKDGNLVLTINHPIAVKTPCVVLFKAGADVALLDHIEGNGRVLVFNGGPEYKLVAGESLHIRDATFRNLRGETKEDNVFTELERQKIEKVKQAGINRWFLSYVEKQSDVDILQEMVGKDAEIWLKIESPAGLEYVNSSFQKRDNLVLVAARGDLFVELDKPHQMIQALRQIIQKDPRACVGSRLLLSIVNSPVPSCADLLEIAWLNDIGYRRMMLCDEICLKGDLLASAVSAFDGTKRDL